MPRGRLCCLVQDPRSPEQVKDERAMTEVSAVLLNLDHTLTKAKKAQKVVAKDGANRNAELALTDLIEQLTKARKRFVQDTYYAGDSARLL
jgi:hypothetical protein